jgi:hypothetical protein
MLARELFPQLMISLDWPWIVMGVGLVFLLFAVFTKTGDLAIPGSIISGIGAILYFQNVIGDWGTWSFAWTLIPGFIGIGLGLAALISPAKGQDNWSASLFMLAVSAVLFILFGGGKYFGLELEFLWPVIVIAVGLFLLIKGFVRR